MSGEINARQNTKNNCFLILRTPQSQASEHWSSLHYKVPIVLMKQQQQFTAPHPHQLYIIHLRQAQESSGCSSTITSEPSTQSHHPISSYPSSKWQHSHHIILIVLPNGRTQSYLVFVLVVVVLRKLYQRIQNAATTAAWGVQLIVELKLKNCYIWLLLVLFRNVVFGNRIREDQTKHPAFPIAH